MSASAIFLRHHTLRWLLPAGVAGFIGLAASGMFAAQASTKLDDSTPAQLVADVSSAKVAGLSGTLVSTAHLGLPSLPTVDGSDTGSLLSMLSGSHSARIWVAGPDKQRVALLESVGESDLFRNGRDVWQWSSSGQRALHTTLPATSAASTPSMALTSGAALATLSPSDLAQRLLSALGGSTDVSVGPNREVAGRAAYDLVLTPKDAASRIGSVHIEIDGQHKIPVGVQIFARGNTSTAAVDVAFSSVDFSVPGPENFVFTPPSGATVVQQTLPTAGSGAVADHPKPTLLGQGWTAVVELPVTDLLGAAGAKGSGSAQQLLNALPAVHGSWGSGRLLDTTLFSALVTNDGRVLLGPVDPSVLYTAAAR